MALPPVATSSSQSSQANSGLSLSMPPYSSPLVNPKTGMMSVTWQLWFQVLFNRIGGLSAPPINLFPDDSPIISNQNIPTSQTVMYTSPGAISTILDLFQIQNKSNANATVSCWIVPPGAVASPSNIVINSVPIIANSIQNFPAQVGTILAGGGTLVFLASLANALQPSIRGRQAVT